MSQLLFKRKLSKPIAITSLVDVVFILLLFFMISSSFNDWNAIHLKRAVGGKISSTKVDSQLLVVHARGGVSLVGEEQRSSGSLQSIVNQLSHAQPIVLFPESSVTVQVLVTLFDTLQKSGFKQVSLGKALSDSAQS